MTNPIKKPNSSYLVKTLRTSLLTIPLLVSANLAGAAESVEDRISALEAQIKALKKEQQERKEVSSKTESKPNGKHSYQFGGFIKATATYSDYSGGDLAANSGLRDFYIPGAIPVGGTSEDTDFDFTAKETRINFKSTHQLDNGKTLTTFIEMDFLLPPGGNERVSNSYNPRMRHAFFKYDNWLFGQTWSTF